MFPFINKAWNPVVGCEHHCIYCWARKLAEGKLRRLGVERYRDGFKPKLARARNLVEKGSEPLVSYVEAVPSMNQPGHPNQEDEI